MGDSHFVMGVLLGRVRRRLMLHLLKNGPKSDYGINEKISLPWADCERDRTDYKYSSYETIQLELGELTKKGFLEFRESDEVEKFAQMRGRYHLTGFGLAALCVRFQDSPSELRKILSASYVHWKDLLPLVLGKWDLFLSEGVDDLACSNLINASHLMIREFYAFIKALWEWACHKRQNKKVAEPTLSTDSDSYSSFLFSSGPKRPGLPSNVQQMEAINLRFYAFDNPRFKDSDTKRWLQVCRKDSDILAYLKERLQEKIEVRSTQIKEITDRLTLLDR